MQKCSPLTLLAIAALLFAPVCGAATPDSTTTPSPTSPTEPSQTPKPTVTRRLPATATLEPASTPPRTKGKVVGVVSGDTIEVEIQGQTQTVRYIGIDDCPETQDPSSAVEWMGPQASQANNELIAGETVHLEEDTGYTCL